MSIVGVIQNLVSSICEVLVRRVYLVGTSGAPLTALPIFEHTVDHFDNDREAYEHSIGNAYQSPFESIKEPD